MIAPNLKTAIVEFVKDEFRLEPTAITEDLNFVTDLGLDSASLTDLLARLQEALDFTLPEEKTSTIQTLEDLFQALEVEPSDTPPDTHLP